MHVHRMTIKNIRSIQRFVLDLSEEEDPAGWHVILGDNGAGKSTVVRALALAFMGQPNAYATREDWSRWLAAGCKSGHVSVEFVGHDEAQGPLSREDVRLGELPARLWTM